MYCITKDRINTNVYTSEKRSEINEEREEVSENVTMRPTADCYNPSTGNKPDDGLGENFGNRACRVSPTGGLSQPN